MSFLRRWGNKEAERGSGNTAGEKTANGFDTTFAGTFAVLVCCTNGLTGAIFVDLSVAIVV
jgi:hypothetical protein